MRHILAIIALSFAGLTVSCTTEKRSEQPEAEAKPVKQCFEYIANKDTVTISLGLTETKVAGSLSYKLYEKDKSRGTIVGEMKGDTLIADYTFFAEGVTSVSEVVFLKRNNQLIQGFGETATSEGKQVFKNRNTLDFNDSLVLTAVECKE